MKTGPRYSFFSGPGNDRLTFRFNVINLAESKFSRNQLEQCIAAIEKDSTDNFYFDWGRQAQISYPDTSAVTTEAFWDGTSIPIIVDFGPCPGCGGYHNFQGYPHHQYAYMGAGGDVFSYLGAFGVNWTDFPHFPAYTPWIFVSYTAAKQDIKLLKDMSLDINTINSAERLTCMTISHEIHETLGNDQLNRYHYFDQSAPFVQDLLFLPVDLYGNPLPSKADKKGYYKAQKFRDVFPWFMASIVAEAGDAVNWIAPDDKTLDAYPVDGWLMANYPTPEFFNCYYRGEGKFDHNGNVEVPCNPYNGIHEFVLVTDFTTGFTWFGTIYNYGPQPGYFAPDTTWFQPMSNVSYIIKGMINDINGEPKKFNNRRLGHPRKPTPEYVKQFILP